LAKYLEYTTLRYWHDVRIQYLYLGQYMRNIPYCLNIGSILHQYGCATRDNQYSPIFSVNRGCLFSPHSSGWTLH